MGDLAAGVRVARIDDGDVDRARQRIAPDGDRLEALAEARREAGRELAQRGHADQ
jgi:hypothetical protein